MLRQVITRIVISVALLCGSFAWSGWVFLHSVGDPHRAERIATAILDDPAARAEVAAPLADQIIENFGVPTRYRDTIATTVADVLGDPDIVGNFIAAFGSAQANALGVDDPRPTTIDAGALVNAVRARLALTQPELAAQIPDTTASIDLPKVQSPVISRVRSLAGTWTVYLGLISLALLVAMMVVGDRRRVLRSYGIWAILTGAFWAIGPRIAPWFAHQTAPNADALVGATVTAVAGPITMAATVLVLTGVAAIVVRYTVFADRNTLDRYAPQGDAQYVQAATVIQPVMAGHASPSYGLTRTDQVPVQQGGGYAQPQYAQPQYAQPGQPQFTQPQHAQPQHAQPQFTHPGPQWASTTMQSPPFGASPYDAASSPYTVPQHVQPPSPRAPIPDSQDDLPRNSAAIPLLITPLDLPTNRDLRFPITQPGQHPDTR